MAEEDQRTGVRIGDGTEHPYRRPMVLAESVRRAAVRSNRDAMHGLLQMRQLVDSGTMQVFTRDEVAWLLRALRTIRFQIEQKAAVASLRAGVVASMIVTVGGAILGLMPTLALKFAVASLGLPILAWAYWQWRDAQSAQLVIAEMKALCDDMGALAKAGSLPADRVPAVIEAIVSREHDSSWQASLEAIRGKHKP